MSLTLTAHSGSEAKELTTIHIFHDSNLLGSKSFTQQPTIKMDTK